MRNFYRYLITLLSVCLISGNLMAAPTQYPSSAEAEQMGYDAYLYAYPMILMDFTRQQLTNYARTQKNGMGPENQFNHFSSTPDDAFKEVIRPNVDTLYSTAWLDLKKEPLVLVVPSTQRYFMLPMLSYWTDVFAVPGTRTTGPNRAKEFLVTDPSYHGNVPKEMTEIKSPTRYVWIIGRTQTHGKKDYTTVHAIQAQYKIIPLSAWGKGPYAPPLGKVNAKINMKMPPPVSVDKMTDNEYFNTFTRLLVENPPNAMDYPFMHRIDRLNIAAGEQFKPGSWPDSVRSAFMQGVQKAKKTLETSIKSLGGNQSPGWKYDTHTGVWGDEYLKRAVFAKFGLGINIAADAVYPSIATDQKGQPLNGEHKYQLTFQKGKLPPVNAFWSLTAYDQDGYLIKNPIKRYAIGSSDSLKHNPDGSTTIYMQAEQPDKSKLSNWLPVPNAPFGITMRLYSPSSKILQREWKPPAITEEGSASNQ